MKQNHSLIQLITLPKILDDCTLCFAEHPKRIPFPLKRVYYILQATSGLPRGAHAHHKTQQVLFCIQGSITMLLDDGQKKEQYVLNQPEVGIFLDKMIWHEMHDFQSDTVLLVLASKNYQPEDYIRDYKQFLKLAIKNGQK